MGRINGIDSVTYLQAIGVLPDTDFEYLLSEYGFNLYDYEKGYIVDEEGILKNIYFRLKNFEDCFDIDKPDEENLLSQMKPIIKKYLNEKYSSMFNC